MNVRPSIAAAHVTLLLAYLEKRGVNTRRYAQKLGLDGARERWPSQRIDLEAMQDVWADAARRLSDPALPIEVATSIDVSEYGLLGLTVVTSKNLREAYKMAARYQPLFADTGEWKLSEKDGVARMTWTRPGALDLGHRLTTECVVAEMIVAIRRLSDENIRPSNVCFRHSRPIDISAHEKLFRSRICFDAEWDGLEVDAMILERPTRLANPQLSAHLVAQAERALVEIKENASWVARVQRAVEAELEDGDLRAAAIARRLGIAERTLRRRLDEAGVGYRRLLTRARMDRATSLLKRKKSIEEVALAVGFSETSAFSRAFKHWFGISPSGVKKEASWIA